MRALQSARHRTRHSRHPAAVACGLLVAAGLIAVAVAQLPAGALGALMASALPGASASGTALGTTETVAPVPGPAGGASGNPEPSVTSQVVVEVEQPTRLAVPDIGVESVIQQLGLNDDGSLEVPAKGPLYDQAGWYTGSPRPGAIGPAILLGHVNGNGGKPSVFSRLSELRAGQVVTVDREDGSQAHFEVYRVDQYPKDDFPTAAVYGDTSAPELRLITCAGEWDVGAGSHRDNTVVYATLISDT